MPTVEEGIQVQLRNIEKRYGRTIDELMAVVDGSGLANHNEVVAMLKQNIGMSHGDAHRVSLVARSRVEQTRPSSGDGPSPALNEVHDRLLTVIARRGNDIEQAPKKGYVSVRRRKQFAMLQPGAKWINVGLILPQRPPDGRFEPAGKWNAMFTHRVRVATPADIDGELESWLRAAYDAAA